MLIGISRPGIFEECCAPEKIWRVQDRNAPGLRAPPGVNAFHYPSVVEHEARFFVIDTVAPLESVSCFAREAISRVGWFNKA